MFLVVCSSRLAWRSKRARARHSHAALQLDGLGFGWIVGCSLGKIKRPVALKWCASSAKSHRMPGHTHHSLHWSLLYAAVAALLLLQSGFVTHHHTKQTNENEACCSAMVFNAPYFFFSFPVGLVFGRAQRFTKSCSSQRLRIRKGISWYETRVYIRSYFIIFHAFVTIPEYKTYTEPHFMNRSPLLPLVIAK